MNQKHYLDKFTQYNGYSVPLGMPSNVRMCSTIGDSFSTVGDIMKNVGELNIPHSMMISSYMYQDIPTVLNINKVLKIAPTVLNTPYGTQAVTPQYSSLPYMVFKIAPNVLNIVHGN